MSTKSPVILTSEIEIDSETVERLEREMESIDFQDPKLPTELFHDSYEVIGDLPDYILRVWYLIQIKQCTCLDMAGEFALERSRFVSEMDNINAKTLKSYLESCHRRSAAATELEFDIAILEAHFDFLVREHFGEERFSDKPTLLVCGRTLVQCEEEDKGLQTWMMPPICEDVLYAFGIETEPAG